MIARARQFDYSNKVGILIEQGGGEHGGERMVAAPCRLRLVKADRMTNVEPTFTLTREAAQSLAEELAALGYAPRGSKLEGLYEAQSKHLEDMQRLVFEKRGGERVA